MFGRAFLTHAVWAELEASGILLSGWICMPELERRQSDWQFFYLNGRIIRDKLIGHAIRQAFGESLGDNFQPAYVLYLTVDPGVVDVNVHPTKHEVRFQESRYIHDFIVSALSKVLANKTQQSTPGFEYIASNNQTNNFNDNVNEFSQTRGEFVQSRGYEIAPAKVLPLGTIITPFKNKYLLAENESGLVLVSIKELQLQLLYQTLLKPIPLDRIKTLIIPETIIFSEAVSTVLIPHLDLLKDLGIVIDGLGECAFVIRRAGDFLKNYNLKQLIESMFSKDLQQEINKDGMRINFVNAIADQLDFNLTAFDNEVLNDKLRQLEKSGCPHTSYRGKAIWRCFSLSQLNEFL